MKRISWVLCSFLLVSGFLTSVTSSQAVSGPQLSVGAAVPLTVRGEGTKEKVADVNVGTAISGEITAGSKLLLTYTVGIANSGSIAAPPNVTCAGPDAAACNSAILGNVSATSGGVLTIKFGTNTPFTGAADSIAITGIRVNANALPAGGSVSAAATAVVPAGGNSISFAPLAQSTTVANVVALSTKVTLSVGPGSVLSCAPNPANSAFTINVAENFAAAFTSASDETALGGCPVGGCGASSLLITIASVPLGVTLTPGAPSQTLPLGGTSLGLVAIPPAQTSNTTNAGTLTFLYTFAKTDTTTVEAADLPFTVALPATLPVGLPTVKETTSYSPTPPATATPLFATGNTEGTLPVLNISDCVTDLLLPWVTNFQVAGSVSSSSHYDTGISIANTTVDPFMSGKASPQSGNCTLTMYPFDGKPASTYSSGPIISGTTLLFTASQVWAGLQGYVIGWCNFQNAHAYVYVVDNAGLGPPKTAANYLGLVIPNTSIWPRNPGSTLGCGPSGTGAPCGAGEILGQ